MLEYVVFLCSIVNDPALSAEGVDRSAGNPKAPQSQAGRKTESGASGIDSEDIWGPETEWLRAGIRLVRTPRGLAIEYVLQYTQKGLFEGECAKSWTFFVRGASGQVRSVRPDRQLGTEGMIFLRQGETRRGKMMISDIFRDLEPGSKLLIWAGWGPRAQIKSGTIEFEVPEEVKASKLELKGKSAGIEKRTLAATRERIYPDSHWRVSIKQGTEEPSGVWGNAVNGVRCGIVLSKQVWQIGTPFFAKLLVHNAGEKDILHETMGVFKSEWSVKLVGPDGKKAVLSDLGKRILANPIMFGRGGSVTIQPGEAESVDIPLDSLFVVAEGGDYTLTVGARGLRSSVSAEDREVMSFNCSSQVVIRVEK